MARMLRQIDDEVLERPFNKGQFLRLLSYMKPYRKNVALALVLMIISSLCSLASTFLLSDAVDALEKQGATSLILDLRDNPGGWVDDAVSVADRFLDKQLVVYSKTRTEDYTDPRYTSAGADNIPLVLLVNGSSASSSEILSGCLQDHKRATIVGTTTFGKGIMQQVIPLSDGETGIQFTYCEYFTPNGNAVHKIGITPDVQVEMPESMAYSQFEVGDMTDVQLKAAWEEAVKLPTSAE
mgnify:CR=1 FL=1